MHRTIVAILLILCFSTSTFAADLRSAVAVAAAREAAAQPSRPAARGENPYKVASIALMGGGALLTIWALAVPSGAKCESDYNLTSIECGTTTNKGLLFTGLGAAGAGVGLYLMGERRRSSPQIVVHGGRVMLRQRITW